MIKIRLTRQGSNNNIFYKVVAIEEKSKRQGQPLETLGYWQPSQKLIKLDKEKVNSWVKKGAKVSPAVKKLMK